MTNQHQAIEGAFADDALRDSAGTPVAAMTVVAPPVSGGVPMVQAPTLTGEQVALLKRTIAKDCTDDELQLFIAVARRLGLDPFAKQIYAIKRPGRDGEPGTVTYQTSIDGFRLQAVRSGKVRGILGPWWCGEDGVWKDVWLSSTEHPLAAKVEVVHADYPQPVTAVARWDAYVQTTRNGTPNNFWSRMGDLMLGKCAESLALRRAFPAELSGIYTDDEMPDAVMSQAPYEERGDALPGVRTERLAPPADAPAPAAATTTAAAPAGPRREPTPPQPRPAAATAPRPARPAAPAPGPQAAAPADGPRKPFWADAMKARMQATGITLSDVTAFLGSEATNEAITEWLGAEAGRNVAQLVDYAVDLASPAAGDGAEDAPASGEENEG